MYSRVWVGAVAPRLTKGQEVLGDRWGPASCNLQREPVQWMSWVGFASERNFDKSRKGVELLWRSL